MNYLSGYKNPLAALKGRSKIISLGTANNFCLNFYLIPSSFHRSQSCSFST